jgi:hypothetical protein
MQASRDGPGRIKIWDLQRYRFCFVKVTGRMASIREKHLPVSV